MTWVQKCIGDVGTYNFRCLGCHERIPANSIYFVKENSGTQYSCVDQSYWKMAFCVGCARQRGIAREDPGSGYSVENFNLIMKKIEKFKGFVSERFQGYPNNPSTRSNILQTISLAEAMLTEINQMVRTLHAL